MSQTMEKGKYDNCRLVSAVYTTSDKGEQFQIKFEVFQETFRTAYLSMKDEEKNGFNPFREITVPTLKALGFNGNPEAPAFAVNEGISLYCNVKPRNDGKPGMWENWNLAGIGFKEAEPASADVLRRAKAVLANALGPTTPRPAGAPTPPPASPPKSAPPPAAAPPPASKSGDGPGADDGKWDKNRAWEYWNLAGPADVAAWTKVVNDTPGMESDFGSAGWHKVACGCPPF